MRTISTTWAICFFALLTGFLFAPLAQAVVVQTNTINDTSQTFWAASNNDLIDLSEPTLLLQTDSGFTGYNGGDVANLHNGDIGAASTNTDLAFDLDGTWTSTFFLDTVTNNLGYNVERIDSYAGWTTCCVAQGYEVLYSTVDDASFTSLGTFSYDPTLPGSNHSTWVALTDSEGFIATGVDAIQFNFALNAENALREIDIFGSATVPPVPEPSTFLLLGLGAITLVRRTRRRGRKA